MTNLANYLDTLSSEKRALLDILLKEQTAVAEIDAFPLSFAQQRLWFLSLLEPDSPAYNLPAAIHVRGRLDPAALRASLDSLAQRHETLRTTFAVVDGEPAQQIHPELEIALPLVDLSHLSGAAREAEVRRLAGADARSPFDLQRGPLLRASLLRLQADEHVLLLTMHHIISDGWSIGIFVRELAQLYVGALTGHAAELPELPIQYADFSVWQREQFQGAELEQQLDYWRAQLADAQTVLELPADAPRPPVQTFNGAHHAVAVSAELADALRELSRREDATLFMTLLAAFDTLLHRYTGQTDLLVGSPIANRNLADIEGLIGFFVNTLILRSRLDGAMPFVELLRQVRDTTLGAFDHQDVPFEMLVEMLHPQRDLSRAPLFQVMFVYQSTPVPNLALPGLSIRLLESQSDTAKFDLTLTIEESGAGLLADFEYNTDLFAPQTIERLAGHWLRLLRGITEQPQIPLGRLPLLTAAEQQGILGDWNATRQEYDASQCLHTLVADQARRTPEAPALIDGERRMSYAELEASANRLAHYLQSLGVAPEARVGICLPRTSDIVVSILAVLKAGGVYVPLDPAYPQERVQVMSADAQLHALITTAELRSQLPELDTLVACLDQVGADIAACPASAPTSAVSAANLAYIIYTSGSTGKPKGVAITHRNAAALLAWARPLWSAAELAGVLAATSICFDLSVYELFLPLSTGGAVILAENALALPSLPAAGQVTLINTVPSAIAELARSGGIPDSVRTINLAGEALPRAVVDALYALPAVERVYNLYGPSEDTTYSTAALMPPADSRQPSIGRPISNTAAYVLDPQGQPAPIGVPGELYLSGDGLARGYLNQPALTAERFVPNPFGPAGSRMYRTGDLARFRPDGELEFLGRADHQVKVRGFRIELGEIEAAIREQPSVHAAVVLVRTAPAADGLDDQRIVAYVVARPGQQLDSAGLRRAIEGRLPAYMVPNSIVALDELPLTPNGKLDRQRLPLPEQATPAAAPRGMDPLEELVAMVMADVLGAPALDASGNFFELGGHSLLATQMISRLRAATQIELPLRALFEAPTPAALSRRMRDMQRGAEAPIVAAPRDGVLPLSFAQERLWFLTQLDADSATYHIPAALRLQGALDIAALEQSLTALVERHESLRTTFRMEGGRPAQIVQPAEPQRVRLIDLGASVPAARQAELERLARDESDARFDLLNGPLHRATLVRLAPDEAVLLLTLHHIIADAWSIELLIAEFGALYAGFAGGSPAALPPQTIQYADFAMWQRRRLQGALLEQQLGYWRTQLAHVAPLELPLDHPRPLVQTFRGATYSFSLPDDLAGRLKDLGRRHHATLFMTMLAAFKALLARWSGQQDIAVGSPATNRDRAEFEGVFGFFLNMLVLRTEVDPEWSFRTLLERVRETALAAYAHQDMPFEKLVEELRPDRDLSRNPLFQVMFVLQHAGQGPLDLPDLTIAPLEFEHGTAKYDLTLSMLESGTALSASIEYNRDLFEPATIERMAGHLAALLASIAADPERPLGELEILPPAERELLLVEWNDTAAATPERCIHELFEAQVARTPAATALVFREQSLSYAELNQRANALARQLRALGVGPDDAVGVYLDRSLEMMIALLGTLKAGGAYVPLDPAYPHDRLAYMVEDARVQVVLTQEHLRQQVPGHPATILAVDAGVPLDATDELNPPALAGPANLAYLIYTSGSTGKPKGVMVAHASVANFFVGMDQRLGGAEPGTWLAVTSMSFDISVLELFWTLARGYKVVIQPELDRAPQRKQAVSTRPMDFSLFYFSSDANQDGADKYRLLLEGAKFADRHGFSAVWTPERHFHEFGGLYPNPSVVSAALAAITERIQIRAGSVVLPLQNPVRVAEEWSVVDNLSNGRAAISVASGWHADDFVLAPGNYADRKALMFSGIETVRRLWRGEAVTLTGGGGNDVEVRIHPRPIQAELPMWVTAGGSPETFAQAGAAGARLLTHLLGQSVEELAEKIAVYRRAWREHGHGPDGGYVTLMIHTFVGEDLEAVRETVRRPFYNYLRSSLDLWRNLARSMGYDIAAENFSVEEEELILEHAFNRYFETSSLLGTPDTCCAMIERLKHIEVDEVGCLIDFGVPTAAVLDSLRHLDTVRDLSNRNVRPSGEAAAAAPDIDEAPLAQMIAHQVTHLQCTPSMARMLMMEPEAPQAFGALSHLLLGGEALPAHLAEQVHGLLGGALHNMYGPTETTIWSTSQRLGAFEQTISIGRPIANTEIYILDRALQPQPIGIPGEGYIGGAGVVRGYFDRPGLTAERFVPNPWGRQPGARMYRTGDLARYLPDGAIEFLGRLDHQVKIQGYRIELGEIEAALSQHPDVREAVVAPRGEPGSDQRLVAYLVPEQGGGRPLQPALSPAAQAQLFAEQRRHTLPNGMVVAHLSEFQANLAYHEVMEDDIYFRHGITLPEGAWVFDVGANIGMFTLFAHQKVANIRLFAFEPIPPTNAVLRANVALYGLPATVLPYGLSERSETVEFTFYPEMAGLSGRYSEAAQDRRDTKAIILHDIRQLAASGSQPVVDDAELDTIIERHLRSETHACQVRALSEVIAEYAVPQIDLLKVDVEKAELDVLRGIRAEDWSRIKQVVMEIDNRENLEQIVPLLEQHGFNLIVEDFAVVPPQDDIPGVYVYMLYASRIAQLTPAPPPQHAQVQTLTASALRAFLKADLPEYMIPAAFVVLPALPLTPNGKIDRRALPEPGDAQGSSRLALDSAYVEPKNAAERAIAAVWQEVLQVERVGINDNFFELGGNSLLIVQARSKLREAMGQDVSLVDMFRHPTVGALAAYFTASAPEETVFDKVSDRAEKQKDARQRRAAKGRKA
jgi:natural product biosynthesis luciferase-like monooxygenase protein/amino acid adenylation domain-containing protein/FkbM family methyltransferase